MRFDELLGSLLAKGDVQEGARLLIWRELGSKVALAAGEGDRRLDQPDALAMIAALRDRIESPTREEALAQLWLRPPDSASLVMLGRAPPERLAAWLERHGADISAFAPALPHLPPEALAQLPSAAATAVRALESFRFETRSDGVIFWSSRSGGGPPIGQTIAFTPSGSPFGVDGHASGAFRRRAPFTDARLTLAGGGPWAGEWRISAMPVFSPEDGRFRGYRGSARRPGLGEAAPAERPAISRGADAEAADRPADALRQIIHELRTPLTAIIGFAEVIEGQFLGPASRAYRRRASEIWHQGERLLAALEDLDLSSRLAPTRAEGGQNCDPAALLRELVASYAEDSSTRGYRLDLSLDDAAGMAAVDPQAAERMCRRLLDAVLAMAQRGETIGVALDRDGGQIRIAVDRPVMVAGRDARTLLDPAYNPVDEQEGPSRLGIGFALRLVRNLATVAGGGLNVNAERIELKLPPGYDLDQRQTHSNGG